MSDARVGLVLVSHSAAIAEGLVDLVRQMAPSVSLQPAGGDDGGGIGTSFERIRAGVDAADSGAGVIVLCDLGSAVLTADTVLDFLDDEVRARVRVVDGPLVEGAVAAGVAAETGGDLDAVEEVVRSAGAQWSTDPTTSSSSGHDPGGTAPAPTDDEVVRTVVLINPNGLHARPAAEFVTLASTLPARVRVGSKDAASLLGVMSLGLVKGDDVVLRASGPGAEESVSALAALIESGFGEA